MLDDITDNQEVFDSGYRQGVRDATRGGPNWLLILGAAGGAYYLWRNPQARAALQDKAQAYLNAAQEGRLGEVASQDVQRLQQRADDLRHRAQDLGETAKKGAELGKAALRGVEPASHLVEDAATIATSDDPQQVGEAVQAAKAHLRDLASSGKQAAQTVAEGDSKDAGKPG